MIINDVIPKIDTNCITYLLQSKTAGDELIENLSSNPSIGVF